MRGEVLFDLFNRGGSAGGTDMIIDPEDHLFVSMTEPGHRLTDGDTRVDKHGAVSVPEVMGTDGHRMTGSG